MEYGVIMAGGAGTRLWPLSRAMRPKQLLNVIKGKSLLQLAFERLLGVMPAERIYVCTAAAYGPDILKALPQLPKENLLGEPQGRDTAAAVGFPAAVLLAKDKDAVAAYVTADHVIQPIADFQKAIRAGFEVAKAQPKSLVTFGITPTFGHTGLGYVQRGEVLMPTTPPSYKVLAFKEKPDKSTADRYVESGRFFWNSGMFVWRCDTVLDELKAFLPETHKALTEIAADWQTPKQQETLNRLYPTLQKISVDYAIMEPASHHKGQASVVVVEMPVQWLDVGSWPALAETLQTDDHNNAFMASKYCFVDSDDNIVITDDPEHLVTTIGVSDMIIVHTKDATMVCPKNESQRVKDLVGTLKEKYGPTFQ